MDQDLDDLIADYVDGGGNAQDWVHSWLRQLRPQLRPSYNISPTNTIAIVREALDDSGEPRRRVDTAVWDLRPSWRTKMGKPMINARLETVAQKPMWRSAFARRRVLVPMRGYFEWTGPPKQRQSHFIHHRAAKLISAAGLGEVRNIGSDDTPEWEVSTAIITTEAADAGGEVHDRMPVFLRPEHWDAWLSQTPLESADKPQMLDLLRQASGETSPMMVTHPVSPQVNRAGSGAGEPAIIEPI